MFSHMLFFLPGIPLPFSHSGKSLLILANVTHMSAPFEPSSFCPHPVFATLLGSLLHYFGPWSIFSLSLRKNLPACSSFPIPSLPNFTKSQIPRVCHLPLLSGFLRNILALVISTLSLHIWHFIMKNIKNTRSGANNTVNAPCALRFNNF